MDYEKSLELANETYQSFRRAIGPVVCKYLDLDTWTDLGVLADGSIWLDEETNHIVPGKADLNGITTAARILAQYSHQNFNDHSSQNLNSTIPVIGLRIAFLGPPATADVVMDIRRQPKHVFNPSELLKAGVFTKNQHDYLHDAIDNYKNIVFSGSTGSGKTTITNALLTWVDPDAGRIYVVEDTKEIKLSQQNNIQVLVNPDFTYRQAIEASLRFNIKRLIIGECRSGEQVLETFKSWNTGHPGGITTLHANSAGDAFSRLDKLLNEVMPSSQIEWIKESVDVIAHMTRTHDGLRKITGLLDVKENRYVE